MPILPEKIQIKGFFSFRDQVEIDFQQLLRSGGLWGILGPNGAGKSSILEAMLLALYHKCPRAEGRERTKSIRTQGYKGKSEIMFQFRYQGKTYQCGFPAEKVRELKEKAPSGIMVLENPDAVENLLKLKYEDFLLSVVLPQGKFADLLKETAARQVEMLANLLPHRPWEKIEERIKSVFAYIDKEQESLKKQMETLNDQLGQLSNVNEQDLEFMIQNKEQLQAEIDKLRKHRDEKQNEYNKAAERDKIKSEIEGLESKIKGMALTEDLIHRISSPQAIGDIRELHRIQKEIEGEKNTLSQQKSELEKRQEELRRETENLNSKESEYNPLRPYYENQEAFLGIRELYNRYQEAERAFKEYSSRVQSEIESLKLRLSVSQERASPKEINNYWSTLRKEEERLTGLEKSFQEELQKLHIDKALADHVRNLKEGEPCPICGSPHHPNPRRISPDIDEAIKKASVAYEEAKSRVNKIKEILLMEQTWRDYLSKYVSGKDEYEVKRRELSEKISEEAIQNFLSRNGQDLPSKAKAMYEEIGKIRQRITSLEAIVREKSNHLENTQRNLEEKNKRYEEIRKRLEAEIPPSDFSGIWRLILAGQMEDLNEWIKEVRDLWSRYGQLSTQIAPGGEYHGLPETPKIQEEVKKIDSSLREKEEQLSEINRKIGSLESNIERKKALQHQLSQLEDKQKQITYEKELIGRVKKSTEQGALKQYVIMEILLRGLVERMNSYLREWFGAGGLQLRPPKEKGERLSIEDPSYAPNEVRPTATLSGGEQFLVSLAMALSLSETLMTLSQEGNSNTMQSFFFIDEGFDTLSAENFAQVMQTLQRLATEGKCIGLISHKIEAREYLSAYLWVEKKGGASGVEMRLS